MTGMVKTTLQLKTRFVDEPVAVFVLVEAVFAALNGPIAYFLGCFAVDQERQEGIQPLDVVALTHLTVALRVHVVDRCEL